MLNLNKNFYLLVLIGLIAGSFCDDEMSLQVSVVEEEHVPIDLCSSIKCDSGEVCVINENKASCDCIDNCEIPKDERQKVCSVSNQTYDSDCHFLRQKCWCKKGDSKCVDKSIVQDRLDYYGECRHIGECTDYEKEVFPSRMKQWLTEVLHILNKRKDIDPKYNNLVQLADQLKEKKVEKYWTAGVAFEFCQLDKSKDHLIQQDELTPLVSSIKALENCIQPFLNGCDLDKDDVISDKEWGLCLDLSDDDLALLRKYC